MKHLPAIIVMESNSCEKHVAIVPIVPPLLRSRQSILQRHKLIYSSGQVWWVSLVVELGRVDAVTAATNSQWVFQMVVQTAVDNPAVMDNLSYSTGRTG
jgi:hypothetical protein